MARTPDDFPGERIDEALLLIPTGTLPTQNGEIFYLTGSGFRFYEEGIIKTLSASSGMSAYDHERLHQLVHLAQGGGPWVGFEGAIEDEGPMPFPTASIWWTDSSRTKKIVQANITRNPNKAPSSVQWVAFDLDGVTPVESLTDNILYNGAFEVSRSRTSP